MRSPVNDSVRDFKVGGFIKTQKSKYLEKETSFLQRKNPFSIY